MAKTAQAIVVADDLDGQILQYTDATGLTVDNIDVFTGATSGKTLVEIGSKTRKTTIAKIRLMGGTGKPIGNPNVTYITNDFDVPGQWVLDPNDTTSTDDTGTILVDAAGNVYKRKTPDGYTHSDWFKGISDVTTRLKYVCENFRRVKINPGDYTVDVETQSILVKSDTEIIFEKGANITANSNNSASYKLFFLNQVNNVIISGANLIGDKDTNSATGESGILIYVRWSDNIVLSNITATKAFGDGIYIGSPSNAAFDEVYVCENISLSNIIVSDCRRNGISLTNCRNVSLNDIICYDIDGTDPQCGIDVEPNTNCICENIQFNNVFCYSCTGTGLQLTTGTKRSTLNNVICYNNTINGIQIRLADDIRLVNCQTYGNTSDNILVTQSSNVAITGSSVKGGAANGIGIYEHEGGLSITGCDVSGNASKGILLYASNVSKNNILVHGNIVQGNTSTGIYTNIIAAIKNNIITGNAEGMRVELVGGCIITGNDISLNNLEGISATSDGNIIKENIIYENSQSTNAAYNNVETHGSDNVIINNRIYKGLQANKPAFDIVTNPGDDSNIIINNYGATINDGGSNTLFDYPLTPISQVNSSANEPYDVKTTDRIIYVNMGAFDIDINLLPVANKSRITIVRVGTNTKNLYIKPKSGEFISETLTEVQLLSEFETIILESDGTGYYIIGGTSAGSLDIPVPITDVTTTDLSTATLQASYGTKPQGQQIICPDITTGAQVYTLYDKTNGRWGASNFQILPNSD